MPPLKKYLKDADDLAQEVVNSWAITVHSGNASHLTAQFKSLLDKACFYQNARRLADSHRECQVLTEQEVAEEDRFRHEFAIAYKTYYETRAQMYSQIEDRLGGLSRNKKR